MPYHLSESNDRNNIMAEITMEWLEQKSDQVVDLFSDGFQVSDVFTAVPVVMESVELVSNLSSEEKKETAEKLMYMIIDKIDLPWIPDSLVDPLLKRFVPDLIEMLITASGGGFGFNNKE